MTLSLAWRPLSQAHELIWKIGLMEEVGWSDPDVALSRDEMRCQHPVCGMRARPSASHSDSTFTSLCCCTLETNKNYYLSYKQALTIQYVLKDCYFLT